MRVLITGAAGFIGFHVASRLLARGDEVVGFDNFNNYYDPGLKEARLALLEKHEGFEMVRGDLAVAEEVALAFDESPDRVVHLAAQAGVRYSIENPRAYIDTNIVGTLNVLEACRRRGTDHLVYASSSSVYGANTRMPFSCHDNVDHPVSLYAASKKANELMAHTYSHLYGIPTTGLRFFTVYGPWGRPDMALFLFTRAILEGEPINVFNQGRMRRDFTYIDDISNGVVRVLDRPATRDADWVSDRPDPASSLAPYRLYNIGSSNPVDLMTFINAIEAAVGRTAQLNLMPMQPGDVQATYADVKELEQEFGFRPETSVDVGVGHFIEWYRSYYGT